MRVIEASQTLGQKKTVRVPELNDQLDLLTVSLKIRTYIRCQHTTCLHSNKVGLKVENNNMRAYDALRILIIVVVNYFHPC